MALAVLQIHSRRKNVEIQNDALPPRPIRTGGFKSRNMATSQFRRYHYVLAPESSSESNEDKTDSSVYSMQDKETEYVRDESDTCTKSDDSEYTLNSLPTSDNHLVESVSSDPDEFIIRTKKITVEVNEVSSSQSGEHEVESVPSSDDSELGQADYWYCAQCKKSNNHPKYRYCMKCFRLRKEMFPPKPRGTKKRSAGCESVRSDKSPACKKRKHSDSERSSPDASQAKLGKMNMDCTFYDLKTPVRMMNHGQTISSLCDEVEEKQEAKRLKSSEDVLDPPEVNNLTCASLIGKFAAANVNSLTCGSLLGKFSTLHTSSQTFSKICASVDKVYEANEKSLEEEHLLTPDVTTSDDMSSQNTSEMSSLCIMCERAPKNGVFVHMNVAHTCCCYVCALKVWKKTKKCPTCNLPASKVIKLVIS